MPVAFGPVLAYMEITYDEAHSKYFSKLKERVGFLLGNCPKFIRILKSELRLERFVPKGINGYLGFPPLDLQAKQYIPSFQKVPSRDQSIRDFLTTPRKSSSG